MELLCADVDSDLNFVLMKMDVRLKKLQTRRKTKKWDLAKLKGN